MSKTVEFKSLWDKLGRSLFAVLSASGVRGGFTCQEALLWNTGTCPGMLRERFYYLFPASILQLNSMMLHHITCIILFLIFMIMFLERNMIAF